MYLLKNQISRFYLWKYHQKYNFYHSTFIIADTILLYKQEHVTINWQIRDHKILLKMNAKKKKNECKLH